MRLYISGPMSIVGPPTWNRPAFHAAADRLEALGHEVVNPAALDTTDDEKNGTASWEHYLARDLAALLAPPCDGIVLLPNYHASRGALLELHVARALGMKVFHYDDGEINPERMIALVGFAGSGKDEVAKILAPHGFARLAFADPLKRMARALNPHLPVLSPLHYVTLDRLVQRHGSLDKAKRDAPAVRRFLQVLGTEAGREVLGPDVWVNEAMHQADWLMGERLASGSRMANGVVFTDCRFENEAEAVRARGGEVWLVTRPGVEAVNDHASERLAARLATTGHQPAIHNDGTLDDLREAVERQLASSFSITEQTILT